MADAFSAIVCSLCVHRENGPLITPSDGTRSSPPCCRTKLMTNTIRTSLRPTIFRICYCATAKSWAQCGSISSARARQGFVSSARRPAARPWPRPAQTCGGSRASSRQNRDRDQRTPKLARLLPCQWVPRGRMGRPGPDPIGPRTGGKTVAVTKHRANRGVRGCPSSSTVLKPSQAPQIGPQGRH
jgi:hypothetical protein